MKESQLRALHEHFSVGMERMADAAGLTPEVKLTLVCRHENDPEAFIVVTQDDLDEVVKTLQRPPAAEIKPPAVLSPEAQKRFRRHMRNRFS